MLLHVPRFPLIFLGTGVFTYLLHHLLLLLFLRILPDDAVDGSSTVAYDTSEAILSGSFPRAEAFSPTLVSTRWGKDKSLWSPSPSLARSPASSPSPSSFAQAPKQHALKITSDKNENGSSNDDCDTGSFPTVLEDPAVGDVFELVDMDSNLQEMLEDNCE